MGFCMGLEAVQAWVTCLLILYHRRGRIASPCCGLFQAVAHLLAVEGETPRRSAQTRQVSPERRQRRIRWPLDSVIHRSNSSGNNSSASRQAVVVVIIGLGRDGLQVGVRSLELQYNIGQPIATTRHKLNNQSQSRRAVSRQPYACGCREHGRLPHNLASQRKPCTSGR